VKAGQTKSLVIVAPPRALGILRPAYTHDLRKALQAEVDKDFVKMPVHEIEKHLAA
jgi:protein required for attachment to host cells